MILGLDISTSIIGVCIMTNEGEPKVFSYIDLRKIDTMIQKGAAVEEYVRKEIVPHGIEYLFIEDKLSGFSAGKTMMQTMLKLSAFNAMASWIVYSGLDKLCEPHYIHPSTAKATMKMDGLFISKGEDKKELTLKFVKKLPGFPYAETRNGNPQKYCYDAADAYLIARTGYLKIVRK